MDTPENKPDSEIIEVLAQVQTCLVELMQNDQIMEIAESIEVDQEITLDSLLVHAMQCWNDYKSANPWTEVI